MNQLVPIVDQSGAETYRMSTDAASLCGAIVKQTAKPIQGRKFVSVEGWQAIAIAHGCAAGARDVEQVEGGVRAIGEVRRMSDGQTISTAEGFVGHDEAVWYGGTVTNKWGKTTTHEKRADYAIRAMAQTRAISRACRSAFAHVVVMIDAELSTTPAEEVPHGGFDNGEVVEALPSTGETPPAKRQPLDGPYPSRTALQGAIKAFVGTLERMGDFGEFNAWMQTEEVVELEKQAIRDLPGWWETGEGLPAEFVPVSVRIHRKKRELEEIDEIVAASGAENIRAG